MKGSAFLQGQLKMVKVLGPKPALDLEIARLNGLPQLGQPAEVQAWKRDNEDHLGRGLRDLERRERGLGPAHIGALWATVHRADEDLDLGLISARVVTTAGVGFIVDAFQNLVELEIMKYHAIGTGITAEATSDTTLGTEATTQYTTSNVRPAGSLAETSANIFETIATIGVKAAIAVTEHGIFSQAASPGGVLLDRSVFAALNLASGESVTMTYDLSLTAGG